MAIRNAFEDMYALVESMGRRLEDTRAARWPHRFRGMTPKDLAVSLEDAPKEFIVSAKVPGFEKEDIQVEVTEGTLTIRGQKRGERAHKGRGRERTYQSFSQSLTLPAPVKAGEVQASYKNGELKIQLPKLKESQARRISIE